MIPQTTPNGDPVLKEIHQARQRMAEKFGGDITAIWDDARQRQAASEHLIWTATGTDQESSLSTPSPRLEPVIDL